MSTFINSKKNLYGTICIDNLVIDNVVYMVTVMNTVNNSNLSACVDMSRVQQKNVYIFLGYPPMI